MADGAEATAGSGEALPKPDPVLEEVRVAMALNGGVSLAVWMGGCAVELDAARRAHRGPEKMAAGDAEGAVRSLYTSLCEVFKCRLTIDVMTGSSAGGINGALLAATMVEDRRLHPDFVREQWLKLGDLADLLHEPTDKAPRSLMQGVKFATALNNVFKQLCSHPGDALIELPPGQDEHPGPPLPQLDVTVTDVRGTGR